MFSQLGPLFRTTFRQAESADARLEIRREEKENNRKKDDEAEEDINTDALWQDSMEVSIDALRGFLLDFLKSHGANPPVSAAETTSLPPIQPEERTPVSPLAARAAQAYGNMYAQTHTAHPILPPVETISAEPEQINPADLLESSEIRDIHALIADLDGLSKQNIQTLPITMIGTFLESLSEAVRLLKLTRGL